MNTSVVNGLENQLENAKTLLERRNMALKLSSNREFRKLVLEGFCEKECARLVCESADPALGLQERADALAMAQAGGHLRRYLSACFQMGAVAERDIPEIEDALAQARAEADGTGDEDDDMAPANDSGGLVG
jgi:hypothetical protein